MQRPLISIVTPSFNQGEFIGRTITSVLSQSYTHFEYFVIDGGSCDATVEILQKISDPRFSWISEPDNGQADALNKGLRQCQGDLFVWLNSDDEFCADTLQKIADVWQKLDAPALLYGHVVLIDALGMLLGDAPNQSPNVTLDALLRRYAQLIQPAVFAPLEMVHQVGELDPQLHYALDFDLWVRLAERLPLHYVPHTLARYRLHDESKTVLSARNFIAEYQLVLQRAATRGLLSSTAAQAYGQLFALRIHLVSTVRAYRKAAGNFGRIITTSPQYIPAAMMIVLKALLRLVLHEGVWQWARRWRLRLRGKVK